MESLRHDSVKFLYEISLASRLRDNENKYPSTVANGYNAIKVWIHSREVFLTVRKSLGKYILGRKKNSEGWTKAIEQREEWRKQLYRKWLNTGDNEG